MAESSYPVSALEPLFTGGRVPTGTDFFKVLNSFYNKMDDYMLRGADGVAGADGAPGPPGQDATLPHIINGYQIQSFNENVTIHNIATPTDIEIDFNGTAVHKLIITAATNITGFINVPASADTAISITIYVQSSSGSSITWPANVMWPDGIEPTLTAAGLDVFLFTTINNGVDWYGFVGGQNFMLPGGP